MRHFKKEGKEKKWDREGDQHRSRWPRRSERRPLLNNASEEVLRMLRERLGCEIETDAESLAKDSGSILFASTKLWNYLLQSFSIK